MPVLQPYAVSYLAGLDETQAAAAGCPDGPALILAGPGSGKTRTLVARFIRLVEAGVPPHAIMAVTFTKAASKEMAQRVGEALDIETRDLPIGTFHGLTLRMLRRVARRIGMRLDFDVADAERQRDVLRDAGIFWKQEDGGEILDIIGREKEKLRTPDDLKRVVDEMTRRGEIQANHWWHKAVDVFRRYEKAMAAENLVDFADLIGRTIEVFEADDQARRDEAACFRHILVDEFQDSNIGQLRLLKLLTQDRGNIWAVGDDDQSLYGFRGAEPRFILDFSKEFPGANIYRLGVNYRSTAAIVKAGGSLIAHNQERYDKPLTAAAGAGAPVHVIGYGTAVAEANGVADRIAVALKAGKRLSDIAVLYRTSSAGASIQVALRLAGIRYRVEGAGRIGRSVATRCVAAVILMTRDLLDPEASRLVSSRWRADKLAAAATGLRDFDLQSQGAVATLMDAVSLGAPFGKAERDEFLGMAEAAATFAVAEGLPALLREIRGERIEGGDAVVLATIHGAKGLEWDTVFAVANEADVLPHAMASDIEEERRIAFVAFTRPKRELFVSWAAERANRRRQASPFLSEMISGLGPAEVVLQGPSIGGVGGGQSSRKVPSLLGAPKIRARAKPVVTQPALPAEVRTVRKNVDKAVASIAPLTVRLPTRAVVSQPGWDADDAVRAVVTKAAGRRSSAVPDLGKLDASMGADGRRRLDNLASGKPVRAGFPWSEPEDAWLRKAAAGSQPTEDLARTLLRPLAEVTARLRPAGG